MTSNLNLENEIVSKFIFYAGVVLLKTILMSLWTARHRIPKKVFISPEDYKGIGKAPSPTLDPDVERVRRCHQNDLENVLPFVLIGMLYCLTGPQLSSALWHFRIFTGSRLLHTFVYLNNIPQPARGVIFAFGIVVFNNPEDYMHNPRPATLTTDPDVERVRRCHQNDIENVLPFVLIGLLYVTTGPQFSTALWFFRIFACSRLLHTVVYLNAIPQPARAMIFFPGIVVNVSMAIASLRAAWY